MVFKSSLYPNTQTTTTTTITNPTTIQLKQILADHTNWYNNLSDLSPLYSNPILFTTESIPTYTPYSQISTHLDYYHTNTNHKPTPFQNNIYNPKFPTNSFYIHLTDPSSFEYSFSFNSTQITSITLKDNQITQIISPYYPNIQINNNSPIPQL